MLDSIGLPANNYPIRVRLALKLRFLSKGLASQSIRICVFVAYRVSGHSLTLADYSQMVWDFTVAAPQGGRFQALSYQFSSSTELLTSLAAEWYDVRLVVALVKQGSALLTCGWVTARLISRWHLSGLVAVASNACEVTLWIDFHGRGLNET